MWERPWRRDGRDTKVPPTLAQAPLFLARLNVLVHTKEIIGVVSAFDSDEPFVIPAISFLHAFFAFVARQEVYVRSASGEVVQRIVVTLRPRDRLFVIARVGIHADHDLRACGIAVIPGGISFADAR